MKRAVSLEGVFRHCPRCGGRSLAYGDRGDVACPGCGLHHFVNAAGAVVALIADGAGRLLATRRARPPGAGLLDLPGGFIDPSESAEEALVREVREELNLELEAWRYWRSFPNRYPYSGVVVHTVDLVFGCRAASLDDLRPGDDVTEALFVDPRLVPAEAVALASVRAIFRELAATAELDHLLRIV